MTEPWPIHTLVFDLDDTLFAESAYVKSGLKAAGKWASDHIGLDGFGEMAVSLFDKGVRGTIFDDVLALHGHQQDKEKVGLLLKAYRNHIPEITLLPEALEILKWSHCSFNLGLITDGYLEVQHRKVEALAVRKWIPNCILTDSYGREFWKPSPKAFRHYMTDDSLNPAGFVYVGDNPRKDFLAPRALGWKTIRIRRLGGEHYDYQPSEGEKADLEINNLMELKKILKPY